MKMLSSGSAANMAKSCQFQHELLKKKKNIKKKKKKSLQNSISVPVTGNRSIIEPSCMVHSMPLSLSCIFRCHGCATGSKFRSSCLVHKVDCHIGSYDASTLSTKLPPITQPPKFKLDGNSSVTGVIGVVSVVNVDLLTFRWRDRPAK